MRRILAFREGRPVRWPEIRRTADGGTGGASPASGVVIRRSGNGGTVGFLENGGPAGRWSRWCHCEQRRCRVVHARATGEVSGQR